MSVGQTSIYGSDEDYTFGPGAIYINTTTGFVPAGYTGATGTGTAVGKCGPIEISPVVSYAEATSIQSGSDPDDYAVKGQRYEMATTLKQGGIDILESVVDGFSVERDTDNQPVRYGAVNVIGKRKRTNSFQLTFVEIDQGEEQWDVPFKVVDCFKAIPMTGDAKLTFDAENFREYAIMFKLLESEDNLDYQGKKAYFLSRLRATE